MNNGTAREKQIMTKAVRLLKKELLPQRIILFGSRAKGRARRGSDFDIAVDARSPRPVKKRLISEQIEKIAGLYKIDVVFLSRVSKEFRGIIEETGRVLYEK